MKKTQLLNKIDQAWLAFKASWSGLCEDQLATPGVVESWSVKDLLAHVTTWEEEALKYLPIIMEGATPPRYADQYGGLDAFNALMTQKKRSLSMSEVLSQLDNTHHKMVEYIRNAPDELIATETRFRRRIRLDTYSHYPVHTSAIWNWRGKIMSGNGEKGGEG